MIEMTEFDPFYLIVHAAFVLDMVENPTGADTAKRLGTRLIPISAREDAPSLAFPFRDFPFWEMLPDALRCCKSLLAEAGNEEITAFPKIPGEEKVKKRCQEPGEEKVSGTDS